MKKKMFLVLSICFLMNYFTMVYAAEDQKKIVVVSQKSKFKKKVLEILEEKCVKENIKIANINVKKLKTLDLQNYSAILIVSSSHQNNVTKKMNEFIKRLTIEDKQKVVLFETSPNEQWVSPLKNVDALTSASRMTKVASIAQEILGKIKSKF